MAGEVGHVVYAARVVARLGDKVSTPTFWAGTLFPDIRHLGIVSRRRTHVEGASLQTLVGESDFVTGMRVHAWIDATRNVFLQEQNMKESLPWHPFVPHALKLVEDEQLYDLFDDWKVIDRALGKVHDEELEFVQSQKYVATWHTVLQDYLQQKPNDESRLRLSMAIGLSENSSIELNKVVAMLMKDSRTGELVERVAKHFETLLQ